MNAIDEQPLRPDPRAMEQAHTLTTMLQGSATGVAVFDTDLRLLATNEAFRNFRGLAQLPVGMPLSDIIEATLDRLQVPKARAKPLASAGIKRMIENGHDILDIEDVHGKLARVERRIRPDGLMVETIHSFSVSEDDGAGGYDGSLHINLVGRRQLAAALDSMADGFAVFDADGIVVAFNEQYRRLSPHLNDVLQIGASHDDIIRSVYRSGALDLSNYTEDEFLAFARQERINPGEPTVDRQANGRFIRFAGRKLDNGSTVFIQSDITELKQHQNRADTIDAQLTSQTTRMESAIEAMHTGLIMFDADNCMVTCNQAYRDMLGFPDDVLQPGVAREVLIDFAGRERLFARRHIAESRANYEASVSSKKSSTFRYYMADERVLEFRFTPMEDGGSILLVTDMTDDLEASEQLKRYSRSLERSNEELQNFAYVASHDLQEPLRKIEAFGDRLACRLGEDMGEDEQMYLDRIQDAAIRMRQLINDLLSFSRISAKERVRETTDLHEVMEGVMSDLQIALEESRATVDLGPLPPVEADPVQMRQLFQNLLANALKFTRPGIDPLITVRGQLRQRDDEDSLPGDVLVLTLSDNGIGFEPRYAEQIFSIFQRLHTRTEYEGTGIGLATCRKIVERHAGTIKAAGTPGEGAVFTIELPTKQPKRKARS